MMPPWQWECHPQVENSAHQNVARSHIPPSQQRQQRARVLRPRGCSDAYDADKAELVISMSVIRPVGDRSRDIVPRK